MKTRIEYLSYHCPRWNEFPDVELYADQVLTIVQRNVGFFSDDIELPFTSNMINNYVKQRIVKPPVNKRYDRVHLAYFTVVSLLKGFFSIPEICAGIELLMKNASVEELYEAFCEELETAIKSTFSPDHPPLPRASYSTLSECDIEIIRAATLVFANFVFTKHIIAEAEERTVKND